MFDFLLEYFEKKLPGTAIIKYYSVDYRILRYIPDDKQPLNYVNLMWRTIGGDDSHIFAMKSLTETVNVNLADPDILSKLEIQLLEVMRLCRC